MKHSIFSRRDFIKNLGIAGSFSLISSSVNAQVLQKFLLRKKCKDAGAIIRKNFKNLTAVELTAFKGTSINCLNFKQQIIDAYVIQKEWLRVNGRGAIIKGKEHERTAWIF